MRQVQDLKAEARSGTGKGPSYQTRQKGFIPGVLYGGKNQPENVSVERHTLERQVETGNFLTTLYMLDIAGKKQRVIPRAVQVDPVTDRPVHVDFMRLEEGAKVKIEIPVRFKNHTESPGLKKGGVLNIIRHEVLMLCPADNIPDSLEADLAGLDIHGTIHISSIKLPEGAKPLIRERDFTIAS
ncbi:MAG TPA: 50S ribosomal protein L25/general stress protein Ctc, partial [Rhizomicrobium sp.]|nr:50S ribosomal protein L25/general stress protein Ctc [Rhizomicrobium sp.]